jgi:hypothetical protein
MRTKHKCKVILDRKELTCFLGREDRKVLIATDWTHVLERSSEWYGAKGKNSSWRPRRTWERHGTNTQTEPGKV